MQPTDRNLRPVRNPTAGAGWDTGSRTRAPTTHRCAWSVAAKRVHVKGHKQTSFFQASCFKKGVVQELKGGLRCEAVSLDDRVSPISPRSALFGVHMLRGRPATTVALTGRHRQGNRFHSFEIFRDPQAADVGWEPGGDAMIIPVNVEGILEIINSCQAYRFGNICGWLTGVDKSLVLELHAWKGVLVQNVLKLMGES